MLLIEDNFFNEQDCDALKKILKNNEAKCKKFRDKYVLDLLDVDVTLTSKLNVIFSSFLSGKGLRVFPELIQITNSPIGSSHPLHFDVTRESTVLTSITYINDDYDGGENYFSNGLVIKPKKGKTLFFDGKKYEHGVKEVNKSERYVLAIWYSNDIGMLYI